MMSSAVGRAALPLLVVVVWTGGCSQDGEASRTAGTVGAAGGATAEITGILLDGATGDPIPTPPGVFRIAEDPQAGVPAEIQEQLNRIQIASDSLGRFKIRGVPPGEYTLMIDFKMITHKFTVDPGASVELGRVEIEP